MRRGDLYPRLSIVLGRPYHTGELRTLDEARLIYLPIRDIARGAV